MLNLQLIHNEAKENKRKKQKSKEKKYINKRNMFCVMSKYIIYLTNRYNFFFCKTHYIHNIHL